jgi:hypothetical protein
MTRRELGRLMTGGLAVVAIDQVAMRGRVHAHNAVERWRNDFPILQGSPENGRFNYLDSAARRNPPHIFCSMFKRWVATF